MMRIFIVVAKCPVSLRQPLGLCAGTETYRERIEKAGDGGVQLFDQAAWCMGVPFRKPLSRRVSIFRKAIDWRWC
jgi:hypothetical protein